MTLVEEIIELFESQGKSAYFGEAVSQEEHALQAAFFAAEEQAPNTLIAAALLHDIGHLQHAEGEDAADRGIDMRHERAGEAYLNRAFGAAVAEPVALHVNAKRYLCFAEPEYLSELSPASRQSLRLQGGPMSADEAAEFERNPYWTEAVRLRRWDDQAKIPGLRVPGIEEYHEVLERALLDTLEE